MQLVAETLDLEASKVRLHVTRIGGAFGRRLNADFTVEAALIAQRTRRHAGAGHLEPGR